MKYFLTGATGFIGGHLARHLAQAGHQVTALVRDPDKAQNLAQMGITLHKGDITNRESLREPMRGADGVFHVAAWYKVGPRFTAEAERINVQGTRNVLETMQELGIPKGVYTSTVGIYSDTHGRVVDESYRFDGKHLSEYERTKWLAHYEVAEPMIRKGLPLVIVLPGLVYGAGDTSRVHATLVQYLQRKLPLLPERTTYCWSHVDDVAHAHLLAMQSGQAGQKYIIAGPQHTFIEALEMAERISGVPMPALRLNPAAMKTMSALMGIVEKFTPLPEDYTAESLRTIAGVTYIASNAKAQRELGYHPRPLVEGWPETVRYEMHSLGLA